MRNGFFLFFATLKCTIITVWLRDRNKFFFLIFNIISQICGSGFNNRTDVYRAKKEKKNLCSVRVIKCEYENIKLLLQQKNKTRFGFFFCTLKTYTRFIIYIRTYTVCHACVLMHMNGSLRFLEWPHSVEWR